MNLPDDGSDPMNAKMLRNLAANYAKGVAFQSPGFPREELWVCADRKPPKPGTGFTGLRHPLERRGCKTHFGVFEDLLRHPQGIIPPFSVGCIIAERNGRDETLGFRM